MKPVGLIPWSVTAFCETLETSSRTEKTPHERHLGEPVQWANDTTRDENLISSDIRQRSREVPSILRRSSSQASLTMHWNLANLVKIYCGISVLQRFIALSLVVLQKGQYAG